MLTTKYVRDHLDEIKESFSRRKSDYPIDKLLDLDKTWREQKTQLQELQAKRNKASIEVGELKKEGNEIKEKIESLAFLKEQIDELDKTVSKNEKEIDKLLWNMPNVLHKSVKFGKDETENIEIKKWGNPRTVTIGHVELLEKNKLIDIERAAKIAGARFYYLQGDLVLLAKSLERFALDSLVKKGFTPLQTPYLMKREYYKGVTGLGDFEDSLYAAGTPKEAKKEESDDEEMFLVATSEHPMAAMHSGELFYKDNLPIKYAGVSPCFRREAGTHGKDTKGIFRVHQFDKIEQFILCTEEDSWKMYDELIANEEEIFQQLGIPYRVVEMCTGDIGIVAAKKIDLEGWFPSQQKYREVTSASNCTDWQSSRLDIKYDEKGERKYVHTLNATAISIERALTVIAENYANENGTITVPDALVPYMGKKIIQ
ncbi:MAG: serine--tRNA ligase [Candidatus Micrarchaeaceae archaeon]|jgi:seryl-tRNA synthetase